MTVTPFRDALRAAQQRPPAPAIGVGGTDRAALEALGETIARNRETHTAQSATIAELSARCAALEQRCAAAEAACADWQARHDQQRARADAEGEVARAAGVARDAALVSAQQEREARIVAEARPPEVQVRELPAQVVRVEVPTLAAGGPLAPAEAKRTPWRGRIQVVERDPNNAIRTIRITPEE
jgi:hypothetical protein